MSTLIQIKRSLENAATPTLANGEIAFTANGDVLFIGSNSVTIPIASKRTPGVLTANQGLVANSLNLLDTINLGNTIANVVISATGIVLSNTDGEGNTVTITTPNNTEKGGNYYLKADGSWSTVSGATADPAGANTQIQYNDSDVMGGSAGFAFIETSNTVHIGTATVNVTANGDAVTLANSTVSFIVSKPSAAQVSSGDYFLGANSLWQQVVASGSLDALTDVTIATAANNNLLVYDNDTSQWENHPVGNGFSFAGQVMAVLGANGITVTTAGLNASVTNGMVSNTTGIWLTPGDGLVTNATGLHVGTGNGVAIDADEIRVVAGTDGGLISNVTGVWVKAGTGVTINSSGVNIGQSVGTTDNVTFANVVTTDCTIQGNLNVTGTLTTIDAVNLVVKDSLIKLADEQADTGSLVDNLDIGFFGESGNTDQVTYHGLFRDATDGIFKLFTGEIPDPTTTVDTTNVNFTYSTLKSYLQAPNLGSGIFVANSSGVTITANSTWAVAVTANSLSLSTALPGTSGGTGLDTIANNSLLHGNSTNGYTALALGTVGLILQSNGTALVYDSIDGGIF